MARPDTVTRPELALILGVDVRSITNYATESPPIPRSVTGRRVRYPLGPCVRWWAEFRVRQESTGRGPSELDAARQRKTSADARLSELDVALREGSLVEVAEAERLLGGICDELRARILAFTGRVAPLVVGAKDVAEAILIVEPIAHELLDILSRTGLLAEQTPPGEVEAA